MSHRIEIIMKGHLPDPTGLKTKARIHNDLGITTADVRTADVFIINRKLTEPQLRLIVHDVFCDPVIHTAAIDAPVDYPYDWLIEVGFRPGVTDNVGRTATECIERTLQGKFDTGEAVNSRKLYFLRGNLTREDADRIARDLLANDLIQAWTVFAPAAERVSGRALSRPQATAAVIETINLEVDDVALMEISSKGVLALNLEEMKTIRKFFREPSFVAERARRNVGPQITDCELELLAQTWSEHCKHKIFNAIITYDPGTGRTVTINSLFKTYIQRSTEEIRKGRGADDYCLSVFKDNAGVIRFDDNWNIAIKVETHNSPSALDPYGGALTGIVGVNRDPFGTGMGAALIFNTDVFCFAPPNYSGAIPPRLLHPRRVFEGVREGVEHGGNKSGIPTINGAVVFEDRYLGKPLVYCGTGGIMPALINGKPSHEKQARVGDRVVMVGGRIGKDGIHGATFSSEELHESSPVSAVQIGDPITQKRMTDFLLVARNRGLYSSITDNGAGGLSSSVGEMAQECGGAELHLEHAPLKYPGLQPWEILLSEAQERMTVAVPPKSLAEFLDLAAAMDVESTDLGSFNDTGYFTVYWKDKIAALVPLDFLHEGLPPMRLNARWTPPEHTEPQPTAEREFTATLKRLLGRWNICSKERLIRQYDHEVQAGSIIKPLIGATDDGPGDAAVQRPVYDSPRGLAVGCGIAPRYSDIDTYSMMAAVIDESVRNIVAVGADPDYMAGLDNFCWCDPVQSEKTPDGEYKLAQLVRANQALYDVTTVYRIPCVSGKDSMKNDYSIGDTKISIPPTVLFTAIGVVPEVTRAVTPDFKAAGDVIYVLGVTKDETGGSEYFAEIGFVGSKVPQLPDPAASIAMYRALHKAMQQGLIASCHDLSDGGLAVALAESCFSGGLGADIRLKSLPLENVTQDDAALFSESLSRFVVSVAHGDVKAFEAAMAECPLGKLGRVTEERRLRVTGLNDEIVIDADIEELQAEWIKPLGR